MGNKRIEEYKFQVAESTKKKEGIAVCPLCGSKLEKGYVASKAVAWGDKKISNWSLKGLFGGEMIVSRGYPYPITNVEAYRCRKCKIVVFKYGETGNPAES